jgi:hypothetical protein
MLMSLDQRIDVAASGGGSQAAADDQTDDDAAADGNTSGGNSSAGGGVWSVRARCGTHLRRSGLLARAVGLCLKLCPDPAAADTASATARGAAKSPSSSSSSSSDVLATALQGVSPSEVAAGPGPGPGRWLARLAAGALFRTVLTLPAALRAVWGEDLSRLAKQVRRALFTCMSDPSSYPPYTYVATLRSIVVPLSYATSGCPTSSSAA